MNDTAPVIVKTSIADQVLQYLREGILDNRFPGGARLKEREITERLSVSRTPVREALRMLEAEGLVLRKSNGYIVVVERSLEDMIQAFHVRIALETYAVRLVASSATDEQLLSLGEPSPDVHSLLERDKFEGQKQQGAHFHGMIIELTGNARIAKLLNDIIEYIDLYRQRLYHVPSYLEENLVTHRQILEALRSRDEDQAAALMREHLRASMEIIRTLWEQDHPPQLPREEVEAERPN